MTNRKPPPNSKRSGRSESSPRTPKASRPWRISRLPTLPYESGWLTCARCDWRKRPPTAPSRPYPRPIRKRSRPERQKPGSRRRPFNRRSGLGRGVIDLHLKHLELMLQGHARLFGGFNRVVVRLEVTVHHQRVAGGRRFVGAHDFARRLFCFDLRLFHAWLLDAPRFTLKVGKRQEEKSGKDCLTPANMPVQNAVRLGSIRQGTDPFDQRK